MIRYLLSFLLLLSNSFAFAQEPSPSESQLKSPRVLVTTGLNTIIEREDFESNYRLRTPWLVRAGFVLKRGDAFYEYSQLRQLTGEGSVDVSRVQHYQLLCYRHRINEMSRKIAFVIGGGLGLQRENLTTTLNGQSTKNDGANYLLTGLSGGAYVVGSGIIEMGAELRVLASENFRPNPTIGAAVTIGLRF